MKLLAVINNLHLGGAERLLYDQLRLGSGRWECRVVCLHSLGPLGEGLLAHGIPVTELGMHGRGDLRGVIALRRILRDWRPDILHLHLPRSGVLGRLASRGLPHRVVYTEHNTLEIYPAPLRCLNAATYHLNHRVAAVSEAVACSVRRNVRRWVGSKSLVVVPNGVDVSALQASALPRAEARRELGLADEDLVVGNVANLFARKGHADLLQAATRVIREVPRARFVVVGSGDEEAALKVQARQLGLGERLILAGPRREACRLMSAFDVFTLASLYEGMPVALLEAMALGVPAVATSVGGIPEVVVDGETGLLVPPGNPRALSAALLRLLRDRNLRRTAGDNAQRRVRERFSVQNLVNSYDRMYREAVC